MSDVHLLPIFHFQKEYNNLIMPTFFAALILLLMASAMASAQETTANIFPSKDNYLREETNTQFLKHGTHPYIYVGNYSTTRRFIGVMRFTIPSAPSPGDKIAKIRLNLYYYGQGGSGSDIIQAYELIEDFSESNSNYDERDTGINWTTAGALPPGSSSASVLGSAPVDATLNVWKALSLKEDVMSGVNWTWGKSYGIMLIASGKSGGALTYKFVSKDATSAAPFAAADQYKPYLEITYGDDTAPPVISGVSSSDTSFIVLSRTLNWQTNEPSTTVIKYGTQAGNYPSVKSNETKTTSHSFKIDGLKPGTTYYFVVNSTDIYGNSAQSIEYTFTTSSAKSVHPFLMFERIEDTPGYKYRTVTPWKTWETSIVSSSARIALGRNFSDTNWRGSDQSGYAMSLGLAYQITKNTTYAEKAKDALLNLDNDNMAYKMDKSDGVMNYGLTYDWVQPYLDAASDSIIRDKLAILADQVYYDLNDGGANRNYISFADYHGKAYPTVGIIGAALFDYDNPNNLPLKSTPFDWVKVGTDYLFVDDKLHDFNHSLMLNGFDETGKHLIGAYKSYVIPEFKWWLQVYSSFTGKNVFDEYPIAKRAFTSEIWESLPNHYHNNFVTNGNSKWLYHKELINLLDDGNKSYALNHIDQIETSTLLPYSSEASPTSNSLLYLVYENYSAIQRKNPLWTSRFDQNSVYQVFRDNWSADSDWLSLITWNFKDDSNRDMGHHDQLGFEYYSRGDLLLADGGETKYILDMYYGEYDTYHNVIAIENPRLPFALSSWSNSGARGIYKGNSVRLKTAAPIANLIQTPWLEAIDSKAKIQDIIENDWSASQSLSSLVQYGRSVLYPSKDYFIIIDRLEGTEPWTYRNIFRPTSLNIAPTIDQNADHIYTEAEVGHVNGNLAIGSTPYDWLSLPYKSETATGITTNTINWNTTNPYGNKVEMNLFSAPASEILVTKHMGRIAGYNAKSEVFNPIVYFRTAPTNNLYRVTVLLSRYPSEEEKTASEFSVTGTGSAVKVTSSAYEDYIYSGKGVSSFDSFSTDADTLYARKTTEPKEYTMINGSYINYSGAPLISSSKKVDYLTLKKEGNTMTFEVKGAGTAQITLKGSSGSNYIVKRDGVLYTNFAKQGTNLVITSDLS